MDFDGGMQTLNTHLFDLSVDLLSQSLYDNNWTYAAADSTDFSIFFLSPDLHSRFVSGVNDT